MKSVGNIFFSLSFEYLGIHEGPARAPVVLQIQHVSSMCLHTREFWHCTDFIKGKARSIQKTPGLAACSSQAIKKATRPPV